MYINQQSLLLLSNWNPLPNQRNQSKVMSTRKCFGFLTRIRPKHNLAAKKVCASNHPDPPGTYGFPYGFCPVKRVKDAHIGTSDWADPRSPPLNQAARRAPGPTGPPS